MSEKNGACECGHCHSHDHHEDTCGCGCGHEHSHEEEINKKAVILRYVLGAIPVIIGFMSFIPLYIPIIASVIGYVLFGIEVYKGMLKGFARKKIFTEFTLMCVATLGAFAIGEYADAAAVMYLYSLGETISSSAYSSSKKSISELLEISPERVSVIRENAVVIERPENVDIGELMIVRAGERVALDCLAVEGGGSADTSSVTGESRPLEIYVGVECPSGALLTDGSVTFKVLKRYQDSVVAKMRRAVEQAGKRKSSAEKKITRFASVFTPIAFCVALCVFAVGAIITNDIAAWLKAAIMVLVVSCPCSLVLSVPLTYFAGMGNAASRGVIFRGGEVMDRVARLDTVVFDKTGTLTEARLSFDGVTLFSDITEENFISLSASVLSHSPHAAAVSFCELFSGKREYSVTQVENIAGRGIVCDIDGKKTVYGNVMLMKENGIAAPESDVTCIYGAYDGVLLGRLEFSSHVKGGVKETVSEMRTLDIKRIAVISGDTEASVRSACQDIGIDEFYSQCAPDEKLIAFENISQGSADGRFTAYCGDGLNDSAVIAAADVGIAMGGCGSALTVESADIVLMDDDPQKINSAIRIARNTSRVANSNIALSLGIKIGVLLVGVALAAFELDIPIELAIIADVGAAVIAVLNSGRAGKKETR